MEVYVNGEIRQVPEGVTVEGLLAELGLGPGRIAVELDGEIVRQNRWKERELHPGARLEIVQFVGGG